MKKSVCCILSLLLLLARPLPALAENIRYTLEDLYLTVEIPMELITLTRTMEVDEALLTTLGLSKERLQQQFVADHIYLNAISYQPLYSIVITMEEYEGSRNLFNLNDYDDLGLLAVATDMTDSEAAAEGGIHFGEASVYRQSQASFIVLPAERLVAEEAAYERQYVTVYNGQLIKIVLRSLGQEIDPGQESQLKAIVDSLRFTQTLEEPADTGSNTLGLNTEADGVNEAAPPAPATPSRLPYLIPALASVVLLLGVVVYFSRKGKRAEGDKKRR